jgi:hypothetical protein
LQTARSLSLGPACRSQQARELVGLGGHSHPGKKNLTMFSNLTYSN